MLIIYVERLFIYGPYKLSYFTFDNNIKIYAFYSYWDLVKETFPPSYVTFSLSTFSIQVSYFWSLVKDTFPTLSLKLIIYAERLYVYSQCKLSYFTFDININFFYVTSYLFIGSFFPTFELKLKKLSKFTLFIPT